MDTSKVFDVLPHVNEIWVTNDGNFHLHPNNGGKRVLRGKQPEPEPEQVEQPEPEPEVNQPKRGRKSGKQ